MDKDKFKEGIKELSEILAYFFISCLILTPFWFIFEFLL